MIKASIMSDEEEFMEVASNSEKKSFSSEVPGKTLMRDSLFGLDEEERDSSRESSLPNVLVQYAKNGSGYIPMSSTIKTLPPSVYNIRIIKDMPTLVPTKLTTDELLRLPDSKSDQIISEVESFWNLKDKFSEYGFTHKRGFLLYGPPGGGKTSTLTFIMNDMVRKGGIVILGDTYPDILSELLANVREVEKSRPIVVVLEDIDAIIESYGESQVLSLLDGEASIDNVAYLATTNYPENLDGRVINRPSRFDRVVKIGMPSPSARKVYINSRLKEISSEDLTKWVELTEGFSIAHIKELIVSVCCFGNNLTDTVDRLNSMKNKPTSQRDGQTPVGFG